ncbi:N-carbamoyl-L-amino-acid hydrolase [Micromonospora sp. Llam0]|uniref:M20 family metallo-hydrolase n=1 Tax=Micromonospora sp. Llam0 TaxID=2485143 RepID=UPI000FB273CB|nr:M20 family metallo-hydrolase [Micromonospora sp. Llam0]ROO60624.1 N-carbamoyl-L-amino-acid hydrolase [Micromonospora sp. Llam0]
MTEPDIDPGRLLRRLRHLSRIGRQAGGGISRPGFSQAAIDAANYIASESRDDGLVARTDAGGNLLIGRPGPRRCARALLVGSHLDTVVNGGWLDGAYGVVAALEAVGVVASHRLDLGVDPIAVAFANEEGALFPQAFWGSQVLAGTLDAGTVPLTDYHGCSLREALARSGGNIDALGTAAWAPQSLAGYLELHIEQGPVLESSGTPIGVVEAITGRVVLGAEFLGRAAHAGTTPMDQRADALLGAAHLAVAVSELPGLGLCRVATVGRVEVSPASANTIAGGAHMTIDLRDSSERRLAEAESVVRRRIAAIAARYGLRAECRGLVHSRPATTDQALRQTISDTAKDLGLPAMDLTSGAGHDAQIMAAITPIGMIFAPSIGGVSHAPEEDTRPADLIAGARVLLGTVLRVGGHGRKEWDASPPS